MFSPVTLDGESAMHPPRNDDRHAVTDWTGTAPNTHPGTTTGTQ